jgi:cytochrome c oxidase subunit 2
MKLIHIAALRRRALVLATLFFVASCHSASNDERPSASSSAASRASDPPSTSTTSDASLDATTRPAVAQSPTAPASDAHVVRISAKRFEYSPSSITLKKGEPVVLELVSLDRVHGFNAPDFGLRADVKPDAVTRLTFTPDKVGTFAFHCDVFCGSGHEDMGGEIVVRD